MKYLLLLLSFVVILSGCSFGEQEKEKYIPLPEISRNSPLLKKQKSDNSSDNISLYGTLSSGISLSGLYSNIINSGSIIYYGNIFIINFFDNQAKRSYDTMTSPIYSGYSEFLGIYNDHSSLSIRSYNILDIKKTRGRDISNKELCTPSYQEGINYQPKTIEKVLGSRKIYITYAVFDVSGPDMDSFKNYQSEICFVKDDRVYTISISDQKKYRKDIVESFRFLE